MLLHIIITYKDCFQDVFHLEPETLPTENELLLYIFSRSAHPDMIETISIVEIIDGTMKIFPLGTNGKWWFNVEFLDNKKFDSVIQARHLLDTYLKSNLNK
jgi:hypothetical protein